MPGRLEFDLGFGRTGPPRDDGEPMRLLVLGDFSGKAAADRPPLAHRPTQQVDIDNLDDVVRRLEPRIRVPSGEIHFTQIDDFHPDRLYTRLDLFRLAPRARLPIDGSGAHQLLFVLDGEGECVGRSWHRHCALHCPHGEAIELLAHRTSEILRIGLAELRSEAAAHFRAAA